ncbi:hypothetical protein JTB14_016786 [Gonioctena quinquepunctata]|nr:hypothetical protein JTB14_016786 [Gonioctena quinquepunctata]
MDEVPPPISAANTTTSDEEGGDFWSGILDDESPIPLDASEGGFFSGNFVPPPPRPFFLDDSATPDGLTTCDLCSWAWQNKGGGAYAVDAARGE